MGGYIAPHTLLFDWKARQNLKKSTIIKKICEMVFTRSKLTPLQKIGGADYDSEDDDASTYEGYDSDPQGGGGPGDRSSKRRKKPLTYAEFLK